MDAGRLTDRSERPSIHGELEIHVVSVEVSRARARLATLGAIRPSVVAAPVWRATLREAGGDSKALGAIPHGSVLASPRLAFCIAWGP